MIFNFFKKAKPLTTYEYHKKYSSHLITTLDGNEKVELSYESRSIDGVGFFFFLEVARVKKVDVSITDGILFITITKKDMGKDFTKLFNLNNEVKNKPYSSSASLRSIKKKIYYQYKIDAYQLEKLGENPIIEHKIKDGVLNIFIKKQEVEDKNFYEKAMTSDKEDLNLTYEQKEKAIAEAMKTTEGRVELALKMFGGTKTEP